MMGYVNVGVDRVVVGVWGGFDEEVWGDWEREGIGDECGCWWMGSEERVFGCELMNRLIWVVVGVG